MIKVGINDNLVLSTVKKNEKGTLVVTLKEGSDINPLDALNASGSTQFEKAEKDFMVYSPSVTTFQDEPDTFENIMKKIAEVKDPLDHILRQYTTGNNIKWDLFKNTGITRENLNTEVLKQSTVDKIYSNIVDQFITMATPFTGDNGKKLRWLFIRQSKAKHYPSFRRRFLDTYPFVEPMDVPASKLKFSNFEVTNGLASGDAVTGAQTVTEEEKTAVNELFTTN